MSDRGAAAEGDFTVFFVVDIRRVRGVGDIEDDGDVGVEAMGDHLGAEATDFFVDGIDGVDGGGGRGLQFGEFGEDFGDDEPADAIIEGTSDDAILSEGFRSVLIHGGVADAETEFFDVFFICSAEIDIEFVDVRNFLVRFIFADVNRGISDDAGDGSFLSEKDDPASAGGGVVAAADAIDVDEAFLADVFDDEADFVGVGFEHDGGAVFFALKSGPRVAVGIDVDGVREFFSVGGPGALAFQFEAGGAGRIEELIEEFFGSGVHW